MRWRSGGFSLDQPRQLAEQDTFEVDLVAGVVDVDPDYAAFGVVVHDYSLRDLTDIDAWPLRKLDGERIGVSVVIALHGGNQPLPFQVFRVAADRERGGPRE